MKVDFLLQNIRIIGDFIMPTNFSAYQHLVEQFNNKYNVSFRYEEFEVDVKRQENFAENFVNVREDINGSFYEKYCSDLYRKALTNYADRKIDSFNSTEFIQEYAKMMNGYKDVMNKNGAGIKAWPKPLNLVTRVQNDLNDPKKGIPDTKEEYIIKRYNQGELPMRKMRAYAKELEDSGVTDPEKLSTILAYSNALKTINLQRPRWWRIIHPFRNNAEKRDAKKFDEFIKTRFKKFRENQRNIPKEERRPLIEATDSQNLLTDEFIIARSISYDSSLLDAKNEIKDISEKLKLDENALKMEESKENEKKESIVVEELSTHNEQVKNESVDKNSITHHYIDETKKEEKQSLKH